MPRATLSWSRRGHGRDNSYFPPRSSISKKQSAESPENARDQRRRRRDRESQDRYRERESDMKCGWLIGAVAGLHDVEETARAHLLVMSSEDETSRDVSPNGAYEHGK